ncbi:hypothetical protein FOA52_012223 [Chlamydomonas sp. UWO 241]|nr:hypothetical protein FOA52_012223 [Chlamydomonas sp. UWO 241]
MAQTSAMEAGGSGRAAEPELTAEQFRANPEQYQAAYAAAWEAEDPAAKRQRVDQRVEQRAAAHAQTVTRAAEFQHSSSKWVDALPDAPVFRPTKEQWADPLLYIQSIQAEAAPYGLCLISPPVSPTESAASVLGASFKFSVRQQSLSSGGPPLHEVKEIYTLPKYEAMAFEFARRLYSTAGVQQPRLVELDFWRTLGAGNGRVLYGNDVVGSGFSSEASDPVRGLYERV